MAANQAIPPNSTQKLGKPKIPSAEIQRLAREPLVQEKSGRLKKFSRGKSMFGDMFKKWTERDFIADPETKVLTYKDGDEIKGTMGLDCLVIRLCETSSEQHSFEVTGTDKTGATDTIVLAASSREVVASWMSALERFELAQDIADAHRAMQEYEQNLAAWRTQLEYEKRQKAEARKAKQNQDLMPGKKGETFFSEADAILRTAINQAATEKFLSSDGANAKLLKQYGKIIGSEDDLLQGAPVQLAFQSDGELAEGTFSVNSEKAVFTRKAENWEAVEVGTEPENLPVLEHKTEVIADVEDVQTAVRKARQAAVAEAALFEEQRLADKKAAEEAHQLATSLQGAKNALKGKGLFKQKVKMVMMQNAAAQQFQDGLKNTIKQERIHALISQGDNTDEARAIEKLLEQKRRLKEQVGEYVDGGEVESNYDITSPHAMLPVKTRCDPGPRCEKTGKLVSTTDEDNTGGDKTQTFRVNPL